MRPSIVREGTRLARGNRAFRARRTFLPAREMMHGMPLRRPRPIAVLLLLAVIGVACTKAPGSGGSASNGSTTFAASVGSTDLWAGAPQRFQVGVYQSTQSGGVKLVTFGQVGLAFAYLGSDGKQSPAQGPQTTATYLPAPTTATGEGPTLSDPATARGVYQAENVTFDRAGVWEVTVTADVAGAGVQRLTAAFPVASKPALPAPGQRALKTDNLTLASKGVPLSAIDSRALDGNPVPDPQLHRWTIARAIAWHRPALVIFATPTYCQSQFCGPTTDGVLALSKQYANRAVFIHLEIWRDFQKSVVNKGAAAWLYRNGNLTEPWLYLIGADGIIKDRWGPLFDPAEVGRELAALPPMRG